MATTYSVGLEFSAKTRALDDAIRKLNSFEGSAQKLKRQNPFEGTERGASSAGRSVDGLSRKVDRAAQGFGALRGALLGIGIGAFVKTIYSAAAEIERTKIQLKTLTGTAENAERVFSQLQQINKQSPFELKDLTSAASKLSAFGVKAEDLVATTERLGKIAAGTGQSLDGIALAYGQVLAKGRLQGEELLQFQERGIDLGGELQRMLGVTKEEFSDMTSKGKIGSNLVAEAIKNMTGETGRFKDAFKNTADTMDAKLSNLQDAFFMAAGALGKAFEPVFKWMIEQLTNILNLIGDAISRWQGVQNLGPERQAAIRSQAAGEANQRFPGFNPFSNAKGEFYNRRLDELADREVKKALTRQTGSTVTTEAAPAPTPGVYTPAQQAAYQQMVGGGTNAGGTGGGSRGGVGGTSAFKLSSQGQALVNAAKKLGVSPLDLATIIGFETGGSYSPSQWGGAGGGYMGLIQFGAPERRQYGAYQGQSFEEQVQGPVVRYFQDRFRSVGMSTQGASLEDLYTTVLAGNPRANRNSRDSFGTSPRSGVAAMGPHRQAALRRFFGGSMENVGYSAADAGVDAAQGYEDEQKRLEALREAVAERQAELTLLRSGLAITKEQDPIKKAQLEYDQQRLQIQQKYDNMIRASKGAEETDLLNKAKTLELEIAAEAQAAKQMLSMQAITDQLDQQLRGVQAITPEQEAMNQLLEYENQLKQQGIALTEQDKTAILGKIQAIQQATAAQQAAQAAQQQAESDASGIAGTLTGGIKDAIKAAVTGGDVKAALSGMLANLGEKFLDMAMRPLEEMLTKSIAGMLNPQSAAMQANTLATDRNTMALQQAASMGGGGFGGGGGILGGLGSLFGGGGGFSGAFSSSFGSSWGGFTGALSMPLLLAEGGYVNGPTPAVVGEGGEPEYVIPASKMRSAMSRYSAGQRGSSVIAGSGGGGTSSSGSTFTLETVVINSVEYATVEQVRAMGDASAKRGAEGGHAKTMGAMRNNRSTRARLGMNR